MTGLGANFEYDLRRIIALSTLIQLGILIITISVGLSGLAFFFHLLTHALFRALLFMCAGGVNISMGDSQDIRFMGGLSVCMPLTCSRLMVSNNHKVLSCNVSHRCMIVEEFCNDMNKRKTQELRQSLLMLVFPHKMSHVLYWCRIGTPYLLFLRFFPSNNARIFVSLVGCL
jgi:NADH:ubiquinone oxidoreductase subunit 5 (subunit L)/multisubunit Na+/H+ antiporter MnhA subunit